MWVAWDYGAKHRYLPAKAMLVPWAISWHVIEGALGIDSPNRQILMNLTQAQDGDQQFWVIQISFHAYPGKTRTDNDWQLYFQGVAYIEIRLPWYYHWVEKLLNPYILFGPFFLHSAVLGARTGPRLHQRLRRMAFWRSGRQNWMMDDGMAHGDWISGIEFEFMFFFFPYLYTY
jgi:hypothetical protein